MTVVLSVSVSALCSGGMGWGVGEGVMGTVELCFGAESRKMQNRTKTSENG